MASRRIIRRREFLGVLAGAAVGSPIAAHAQQVRTILAVAIGDGKKTKLIKTSSDSLDGVRPYIKGLKNWLANQKGSPTADKSLKKYQIGTNYIIDYRECEEAQLQSNFTVSADVILCMSTTVAREAVKFTQNSKKDLPIVAIVSEPEKENFPANVCGVSAKRSQHAVDQYQQFVAKLKASGRPYQNIYGLHKVNYTPSDDAKGWLGKKVTLWPVQPTDTISAKIDALKTANPKPDGLLIFPADRFFGAADDIIQGAEVKQNLPTFWSVPDWPPGAFGGYGAAQELCGQYLAERIAQIWTNQDNKDSNIIPDPTFTQVAEKEFKAKIEPSRKKRAQPSRKL